MEFYNDNQLDTMEKMVLTELKTYFSQVTNATVGSETKAGTRWKCRDRVSPNSPGPLP